MKKYVLFDYADYYPSGGLDDVVDSFDTLDEAIAGFQAQKYSGRGTSYIVDRDTWEEVWNKNGPSA